MMSAGFQWGLNNSNFNDKINTNPSHIKSSISPSFVPRSSPSNAFVKKRKRIDEEDTHNKPTADRKHFTFKKSKTPKIIGQQLPTSRLIETLDKSSLQKLLNNLISNNPSMTSQIYKLSPNPSISNLIEILNDKYQLIINHLPYKCDTESDYSYLRIKIYLNEFLNCLSDFILWTLPPNNHNFTLLNLLTFFKEITTLIYKLPNFTNTEFLYTKNFAYEQISNSWLIIINNQIDDLENNDNDNMTVINEALKTIHEFDLLRKLEEFNQFDDNYKFQPIIDYLNKKIEQFELISNQQQQNTSLNELITIDYSSYSLKN